MDDRRLTVGGDPRPQKGKTMAGGGSFDIANLPEEVFCKCPTHLFARLGHNLEVSTIARIGSGPCKPKAIAQTSNAGILQYKKAFG